MNTKKKILFFFVHPSKYHLFKHTIRKLKEEGHEVDIAIIKKDVLEDLIKAEGWEYTNIFPEGRRIEGIPVLLAALVNFFRTIFRLRKITNRKKYNLYVTDDVLTMNGAMERVPSLFFTDNDYDTVKELFPLFVTATKVIAPIATELGRFQNKKLSYNGYKALAYLHPKYFQPVHSNHSSLGVKKKFFIRLSRIDATHDIANSGISDTDLSLILKELQNLGEIHISTERNLPKEFEKYQIIVSPEKMLEFLSGCDVYIGDSATMGSEASILGIPSVVVNQLVKHCGVNIELANRYQLQYYFDTVQDAIATIKSISSEEGIKEKFQERVKRMLSEKDDFNEFLHKAIQDNWK